jgi:hypothetical protein
MLDVLFALDGVGRVFVLFIIHKALDPIFRREALDQTLAMLEYSSAVNLERPYGLPGQARQ